MATPQIVAVTTGILFGTAGSLVLTVLAAFPGQFGHVAALRTLGSVAVVVGSGLVAWRRRLRPWVPHFIVLAGTGLITAGTALAERAPGDILIAGLYILIAADSAFFFSWPAALAHQLIAFSACTLTLGVHNSTGLAASVFITGTAALVAAVVAWLVRAAGAAETDPLTGLLNRRGLDKLLDAAIAEAHRSERPLSAAVLDIDNFKRVNDAGGHHVGDALLLRTVLAWKGIIGDEYVMARLGGDEFVVVLPGCALPAAIEVMHRLRQAVPVPHSCSIGVAQWNVTVPSLLLTSADQALYEAKRAGRNRVCAHGAVSAAHADIRRAMHAGELVVHYQPVVPLTDGGALSAEALLRWQDPRRGLVPPADFLPLIENTDLMAEVNRFVLNAACAQAARWRAHAGPRSVSVNVSGRDLLDPDYADTVAAVLSRYRLPAQALVLEITETSLDADAGPAIATLHRLRAFGVRIAIDDFGTGYSGLGRLRRLPVDILKSDRSFVCEITAASTTAPFVQVIIALAGALHLDVIAEGVETEIQAHALRQLGCPRAQGYLFGKAEVSYAHWPLRTAKLAIAGAAAPQPRRHGEILPATY